jgi:hypothetical protein
MRDLLLEQLAPESMRLRRQAAVGFSPLLVCQSLLRNLLLSGAVLAQALLQRLAPERIAETIDRRGEI